VRIATHPNYQSMGYGGRAIQLLTDYYAGKLIDVTEDEETNGSQNNDMTHSDKSASLLTESIHPRSRLPPLLQPLTERKPEPVHWLGVSYGITPQLCKFWCREGFLPLYVRLTSNDITGEHTCIMVKRIVAQREGREVMVAGVGVDTQSKWLQSYVTDFRNRFLSLLGFEFRSFPPSLVLRMLQQCDTECQGDRIGVTPSDRPITNEDINLSLSSFDIRRLDSYSRNLLDYHVVVDIIPFLARLFFQRRLGDVTLSPVQSAILIGIGLQHKTVEELLKELNLQSNQV
jgi:N-acetyltransferase 10